MLQLCCGQVVVYIPTSHVLLHGADLLSLQLLHDSEVGGVAEGGEQCWHSRPTSRVIHTQNISFNSAPGQTIRGEQQFRCGR